MMLRLRISAAGCAALVVSCAVGPLRAQQLIGYVNTRDADVTGASDVLNGQAVLTGSAAVTAREHTAPITLGRGGTVRVCQTSALHVTESKSANTAAPLLFSLDRGAIEIQMAGTVSDSIMTPDLRFTVVNAGPMDLRLRVARNGDTCVENRGAGAPTLDISDPFGETMYQVSAGQHVLFEHGNLHEVVDHERTPCGCPDEQGQTVGDALLASRDTSPAPSAVEPPKQAALQTAEQIAAAAAVKAAEAHPFPAAISEELAPAPEVPQAPVGVVHMQISDSLTYNAAGQSQAAAKEKQEAKPLDVPAVPPPVQAKPAPPLQHDVFHVVGRFFKRLFGG
jgi:hypothetical protein